MVPLAMLLNEDGGGSAFLDTGEAGATSGLAGGRNRKIMVLEPRRVAAKAAARRMAAMLGERVGQRVGYRVKLDTRVSSETRIEVWGFVLANHDPLVISSHPVNPRFGLAGGDRWYSYTDAPERPRPLGCWGSPL